MANGNGTALRMTASWLSGLFGVGLILLVLAELIWNDEDNADNWWRILTAVTGLILVIGAIMFAGDSFLGGALLLIGLVAGGFLTFWTIAGLVWAGLGFILVMWAMMTGSGNGYPNSGGYYRDRDDDDNEREY